MLKWIADALELNNNILEIGMKSEDIVKSFQNVPKRHTDSLKDLVKNSKPRRPQGEIKLGKAKEVKK